MLLFQVLVYPHLVGHQSGGSGRSLTRSMSPACSCRFLPRSHLCENNIDCRRACPLLRMKGVHCGHVRSRVQDMFFAFELMPRHVKTDDAGQQRLNSVLDIVLRLSDATRGRNGLKFARLWYDDLQDSNKYSMGARLPHRCEVIVTCSSTELRQSNWLQVKVTFTELALVILRFCSTGQTPRISVQFSKRNRTWKALAGKAFGRLERHSYSNNHAHESSRRFRWIQ